MIYHEQWDSLGIKRSTIKNYARTNECLLGLSQVIKQDWSPSLVIIFHSLHMEKTKYSFNHAKDSNKQISQSSQNGQNTSPSVGSI